MKKFLEENGYKKWNTEQNEFGYKDQYQKRIDTIEEYKDYPLCWCNDKLFLNIEFFSYKIPNSSNKHESYQIYLTHENSDREWCDIKIYALSEEKLKENLVKYEKQLIAMWETFSKIS